MKAITPWRLDSLRAFGASVAMASAVFTSATACKRPPQPPPPAPPVTLKPTAPPPVPEVQLGEAPRIKEQKP